MPSAVKPTLHPRAIFKDTAHLKAVLQAITVTFLWSMSWVLIKIGLKDIPALTFAGMRYFFAFGAILALAWRSGQLSAVRELTRHDWGWLTLLGVVYYTITQGTQFLALDRLPAVTLSFLLNFTTVVVALMSIVLLAERPNRQQWLGIGIFLVGVVIFFYPVVFPAGRWLGLLIGFISMVANSVAAVLGRFMNRGGRLPARIVTLVSMGIGSTLLLTTGMLTQGLPTLSITTWAIVLWLAVVHTAFAFTLWNHTLRELSAVESSILNNTMLIQIAFLAWLFLGEDISTQQGIGMGVASVGMLMVQLRSSKLK